MNHRWQWLLASFAFSVVSSALFGAADSAALRLVPFPKEVQLAEGTFSLARPLTINAMGAPAEPIVDLIVAELRAAALGEPKRMMVKYAGPPIHCLRLFSGAGPDLTPPKFREGFTAEDYVLRVAPDAITVFAPDVPGLIHGTQTLCQLIRANRSDNAIRCMTINDHPSLRWRCFQDDLTRGPSSKLDTLKQGVRIGAGLKLNLFTYYMEYQYAFKKHPEIGPKDGSLEPDELKALVEFAKPLGVDVLGNQQSFGHFGAILRHQRYAALRETGDVLTPVKEETYQLLDDLYSEVCPLLPFQFFNVCCDETYGLGTGPSKELAQKTSLGAVYAQHLVRIHDLLKTKYNKRMMMWGDIILQHPANLKDIPKDTIMLTWGYDPRPSFEDQIVPFAKSGYEFFVCPGVSNWSRILPDFAVAKVNIRNFVRDGAKHGAIGMLNTSWEDDGEALKGVIWHGHAWAAECAWNASKTEYADFSRRVGAVLFAETADHFGQAIDLLAKAHAMPGMKGMNNGRFWDNDFVPRGDPAATRASAVSLLDVVRPAILRLKACQREAARNDHLLHCYLLGAQRMELIGTRMLDGIAASSAYTKARQADPEEAMKLLDQVIATIRRNRDAHESLGRRFEQLWLTESKPYALQAVSRRYQQTVRRYEELEKNVAESRKRLEEGKGLPPAGEVGLAVTPEAPKK